MNGHPELMTPSEVAQLFRVDAKTVSRWAAAGKLPSFKTPGGHRRFESVKVMELLAEQVGEVQLGGEQQ